MSETYGSNEEGLRDLANQPPVSHLPRLVNYARTGSCYRKNEMTIAPMA